jgi:hypothetical protein
MIQAFYKDKSLVVDILTRAYDSNSSVNYLIKQDKKRQRRIKRLVEYSFETCMQFGEIYLSSDKKGVALILIPAKEKTTLKSIFRDVKLAFFSIGLSNVSRVYKVEQYKKKTRPKLHDYLYFWYYGVDPENQGSSSAIELKNEIFAMADKRNLPILIETTGEKHKNVYQRYGFQLYHSWTIGNNVITYYFLLRQPKSAI